MSNTFFQFKQFTIHQDRCAMKVCTDACLFGALLPVIEKENYRVLDIGAGTGLLSLMMAQLNATASIDAIEIDHEAASQALENFNASPWTRRLNLVHADIHEFSPGGKYDLIISNPPFFEGDLLSGNDKKNAAKHDLSLTLKQLAERAGEWLCLDGLFAVLLPHHRVEYFEQLAAEEGLYPFQKILVRQGPANQPFRGIVFYSRNKSTVVTTDITIKERDGNYSNAFQKLLQPFYLKL